MNGGFEGPTDFGSIYSLSSKIKKQTEGKGSGIIAA